MQYGGKAGNREAEGKEEKNYGIGEGKKVKMPNQKENRVGIYSIY
jgi:hypothetical protein